MAKHRWNPWIDMDDLRGRSGLPDFEGELPAAGGALRTWRPAADVFETEDAVVVRVELPGLERRDVTVEILGRELAVSGERRAEHDARGGAYQVMERCCGPFGRSFLLPEDIRPDGVSAAMANGLLTITVPRARPAGPRRIHADPGD